MKSTGRSKPLDVSEDLISSATPAKVIMGALAKRGCPDLTSSINLGACDEVPRTGGGFCDIYRGTLHDGTLVAIKVLRLYSEPGGYNDRGKTFKRAARELYHWSKLKHPNVLPLMGLATFQGRISMVSEWMKDGDLVTYLRLNPRANRMKPCMDICAGLSYLHANRMVHGDLKAANVMVSPGGTALIADFGNAELRDLTLKFTNTTKGSLSLRWAAPELLLGDNGPQVSKEADVYAYGMTALEVLTGKAPFEGASDNQIIFLIAVKQKVPPRPDTGICDGLWNLLNACWTREPSSRPVITVVEDRLRALSLPSAETPLIKSVTHRDQSGLDSHAGHVPPKDRPLASTAASALLKKHKHSANSVPNSPTSSRVPKPPTAVGAPRTKPVEKTEEEWSVLLHPDVERALDVSLVFTLNHESYVHCVGFSPDGKYLATGCNRSAQIYDTETGARLSHFIVKPAIVKPARKTKTDGPYIRSVRFSPDGKYLATGADDKLIRVWDIAKEQIEKEFAGHTQEVYSVAFSHDGRLLVSGSDDKTVRIWDMKSGHCKVLQIIEPPGVNAGVASVAISPDGQLVATGSVDGIVRIWATQSGALVERLRGHQGAVYSVVFMPDGRRLVSGSMDQSLRLWDLRGLLMNPRFSIAIPQVGSIPSNSSSYPGRRGGKVGSEKGSVCTNKFLGHRDYVLSVVGSPDGQWIVSSSKDYAVHIWDPRTGQQQLRLQGHINSVTSVDMSPVGGLFASGSGDRQVRIWSYKPVQ